MKTLSYSSAKEILSCEAKYAHRKVYKTDIDSDCEQSTLALDLGKALHGVVEDTHHLTPSPDKLADVVFKQCEENNVQDHILMIFAMAKKYYEHHENSGLTSVLEEGEINTEEFRAFIDAVMVGRDGYWWIVDLKTAARWDESLVARLPEDPQLNFYAENRERLARYLRLDLRKFGGCIYRTVTKPKLKQHQKESNKDYVLRLQKSVNVIDAIIPVSAMNTEAIWDVFIDVRQRAKELHEGRAPIKNFGACNDYYRPCPYFSQCHQGRQYTAKQPTEIVINGEFDRAVSYKQPNNKRFL